MSRRDERPADADGARRWTARDAAALREAQALARAYAGGQTVRALATETGRSYGYVHRRVSALTEMRPPARRPAADRREWDSDGDGT